MEKKFGWIKTQDLRILRREITILSKDKEEILYTGEYEEVLQQKWFGYENNDEKWVDVPIVNE